MIFEYPFPLPGAALDDGRGDRGEFPLEMLPEVGVQLVGRHLVVQHEVDGRRDVGEERLPQRRGVRHRRRLGRLQNRFGFSLKFVDCHGEGGAGRQSVRLLCCVTGVAPQNIIYHWSCNSKM